MTNILSGDQSTQCASDGEQLPASESGGARVLVVDHDMQSADEMVSVLAAEGYTVEVATDSQYALMVMESFQPQVVLLSLHLPSMSGHDMTQILRMAPQYAARFPAIRIIYVSESRAMIQQRFHEMPEIPMSSYLFKPIHAAELLDKVKRASDEVPDVQ